MALKTGSDRQQYSIDAEAMREQAEIARSGGQCFVLFYGSWVLGLPAERRPMDFRLRRNKSP